MQVALPASSYRQGAIMQREGAYPQARGSIDEVQQEIVDEFAQREDALEQYELLLQYSASLEPLDHRFKNKANLVKGCQSNAWLVFAFSQGRVHFSGDSDTLVIRGIINLLGKVLDDRPPKEIVEADIFFLEKADLMITFSASRRAGVKKLLESIVNFASRCAANM